MQQTPWSAKTKAPASKLPSEPLSCRIDTVRPAFDALYEEKQAC